MKTRRVANTALRVLLLGALGLVEACSRAQLGDVDLIRRESIGSNSYWSFRVPREMGSIRNAFAYVVKHLNAAPRECELRSVAVATAWPTALAVEQIVFAFDACRDGMSYLATFTNRDRLLYVVAMPSSSGQGIGAPVQMEQLSVDVSGALAVAGKSAGNEMLSAAGDETQVSLFLSRHADHPVWEVRYDAWRDGRPLRYLVVTIDAYTGQVQQTSG